MDLQTLVQQGYVDEFDQAVFICSNPSILGDLKTKATEYCNNIQSSDQGWIFCLDKFFKTEKTEVRFFCLNCLQEMLLYRHLTLTIDQKKLLKTSFSKYILENVTKDAKMPGYFKNKVAQVIALLFAYEYPNEWPSFFKDIFGTLNSGLPSVDMFLRIMRHIDEEVINLESRNTFELALKNTIKDQMRIDCVATLASTWLEILKGLQDNVELVCLCLENVKGYTKWIDISLIGNENYLAILYKFLKSPQYRELASDCLYEIFAKKMQDPVQKLTLIYKADIIGALSQVSMDEDLEFLELIAKIANLLGTELMGCITKVEASDIPMKKEVSAQATNMFNANLALVFKFMNCEDQEVSEQLFPFITAYVSAMKAPNVTELQVQHLNFILSIVRNKMKYPTDFNFDKRDFEEEKEFAEYRQDLSQVFKKIMVLSPQLIQNFVGSTIQLVIEHLKSAHFTDVEISLTMFLMISEVFTGEIKKVMENFVVQLTNLVVNSEISGFGHPLVSMCYFDVVQRFCSYIEDSPTTLKKMCISLLDQRGIRAKHITIRLRSCYVLCHTVKQKPAMAPLHGLILDGIAEFLIVPVPQGNSSAVPELSEEQLLLFETAGSMLGQQQSTDILMKIVEPFVLNTKQILEKQLYKLDTAELPIYTSYIGCTIEAIGILSKGFTNPTAQTTGKFFKQYLEEIIMPVLDLFPATEAIRSKVTFFGHRMIEYLGVDIFPFVPRLFVYFMTKCSSRDFIDFLKLVNQLASKFKEAMFDTMDVLFPKVMARTNEFLTEVTGLMKRDSVLVKSPSSHNNVAKDPVTENQREMLDIQRNFFLFISTLANSSLSGVLRSANNIKTIDVILNAILRGCKNIADITGSKSCYVVFKKLIDLWINPTVAYPTPEFEATFKRFILEELNALVIKHPFDPEFDVEDGLTDSVMNEIVAIQKLLLTKFGKEYLTYLSGVFLPSLRWPAQVIEQYVAVLEAGSVKDVKSFIRKLASSLKPKK